jgi:hypothetical protein
MLYVVAVASWILQVSFCPRFRHCSSSFLLSGFLICFFAKNKKVKDGVSTFPVIDATTACEVQRPPKSSHIWVVEYATVSPVGVDVFCDSERLARAKVKMSARLRNIAVGVAWDESVSWEIEIQRFAGGPGQTFQVGAGRKTQKLEPKYKFQKAIAETEGALGLSTLPGAGPW